MRIIRLSEVHVKDVLSLGVSQNEFDCAQLGDFWTEDELISWFKNSVNICIGIYLNEKLLGYCLSHVNYSINKVFLENIYVAPEDRNKGIGTLLLNEVIRLYKIEAKYIVNLRYVALVKSDNYSSIKLALSCGFTLGDSMIWLQK